jgi:AraC family transcriptional regulator, exoenzyme S synthesis regulatory protein ExsA
MMDSFFDFIKEHPPVKRLQVNDLLLAEYQCPLAETRYDIWSHQNYFIYVISGKKKWFTRNREILVRKGDCLFVRKGAHSVYQYFDSDFCALVLFMPDAFIRSVLLDNQIKPGNTDDFSSRDTLFSIETGDPVKAYFQSFFTYLSSPDLPDKKLLELKFRELIMILSSGDKNKSLTGYFATLCNTSKPSLYDVMENNYNYPMNLDEYARLSGRSLSAFKRDFKKIFKKTPGRWLTEKRLELAKYLLQHTDKSVTETALDSGFINNSHFNRVFKEKYDITPLECSKKTGNRSKLSVW